MTTDTDTAAALASALPAGISYDVDILRWRAKDIAAFQADRLAEQGWVLVRPDDEATVERLARAMSPTLFGGRPDDEVGPGTQYARNERRQYARAALAALGTNVTNPARPGTADTEQAKVAE